jgi:protein involved in polysaccharide export with SLBB domain
MLFKTVTRNYGVQTFKDIFALSRQFYAKAMRPKVCVDMRKFLRALGLVMTVAAWMGVAGAGTTATAAPGGGQLSAETGYRLGPQDKISIKVFEWRPSIDQIYAWEALNADYVIGSTGQLALPLIGEMPVAGLTTSELASLISERLRDRMRLAAAPDATIEVVEYRPFYLLGQVEKPGPYQFQPGMTVLRAISIGGGLSRNRDTAMMRLQREGIVARGELDVLMTEFDAYVVKAARLEAELGGKDEIAFPPTLTERKAEPNITRLLQQETLIFEARQQGIATQMNALRQLRVYLEEEAKSLKSQRQVHDSQQKLVRDELEKVRGLASKGLTTGTRQLELERLAGQLEGDGLRLDGSLSRTRQDISRTDISILELENKRKGDITVDLQETKKLIEQIQTKRNTAAKLVYEAEVIAPGLLMQEEAGERAQMVYKIVRTIQDKPIELAAEENTGILPGDTIKVEVTPYKRRGAAALRPDAKRGQTGLASAQPAAEKPAAQ